MESGLRASRLWFPLVGAALALRHAATMRGDPCRRRVDLDERRGGGGAEMIAVELQFEGRVRDDVFSLQRDVRCRQRLDGTWG